MRTLRLTAVGIAVAVVAGCSLAGPARVDERAAPVGLSPASGSARSGGPSASPGGPSESTGDDQPAAVENQALSAALLRPSDVGPQFRLYDRAEWDWSLDVSVRPCAKSQVPGRPPAEHYAFVAITIPDGADGVTEGISRVGDNGPAVMRAWRTVVAECRRYTDNGYDHSMKITATGFAGPDSFMVGLDPDTRFLTQFAFVRQGELIAQVEFSIGTPPAEARAIAVRAWKRLCVATAAC